MLSEIQLTPKEAIDRLRFTDEREKFASLSSDMRLAQLAAKLRRDNEEDANRRRLLANALRITNRIIPSLIDKVELVKKITHILDVEVETYIYNSPHHQASCMHFENGALFLLMSSGLYSKLTDSELLFVIGHEFGHVVYEHHLLPARAILAQRGACDAPTALQLMSWARRAEISADRIGLLCCQDLDVAAKALIKLSCGLSDEMIEFDLKGYVSQMSDIESISKTVRTVEDFYSTHPFNPIRVVALSRVWDSQTMSEFLVNRSGIHTDSEADLRIKELLEFMDPDAATIQDRSVIDCLVWGGFWVAACDGQIDFVEVESLRETISPRIAAEAAAAIKQSAEPLALIRRQFHAAAKCCIQLLPHQRHAIIQKLIAVAKANMSVAAEEMNTLRQICVALEVNPTFPEKILWQYEDLVFANY